MKKRKLPNLVTILIMTLITIIIWVGFNIFRALSVKPSPVAPAEIIEPLTPTLDPETLSKISQTIYFDDSQIPEISVTQVAVPKPSLGTTPSEIPKPLPSPGSSTGSAGIDTE